VAGPSTKDTLEILGPALSPRFDTPNSGKYTHVLGFSGSPAVRVCAVFVKSP